MYPAQWIKPIKSIQQSEISCATLGQEWWNLVGGKFLTYDMPAIWTHLGQSFFGEQQVEKEVVNGEKMLMWLGGLNAFFLFVLKN